MIDKPTMQTAGIFVDDWKLPVFERLLKTEGYAYKKHPGLSPGTTLLKAKTMNALALKALLKKAQRECAGMKR